MTKKEIIKDMKALRDKVYKYNKQVKPHSENDYWSGEVYHGLCAAIPTRSIKREYDELADLIDDIYGAGAARRKANNDN